MSSHQQPPLQAALRDEATASALLSAIRHEASALGHVRLMEVCGTHTMAIHRYGLPALLPKNVQLLSGPGCPVCVTSQQTIDQAQALARLPNLIVASFGDMMRVPGSDTSLAQARAAGGDVRVVYSPLDALRLARETPQRQVVFLAVGFETTAPTVAAVVMQAARETQNFSILAAHKLVPPALDALVARPDFSVDGFICPGHVSAIIGSNAYRSLAEQRHIPCVVAGFEPVDVLLSVLMLLRQIKTGRAEVEVEYRSVVRVAGNLRALELLGSIFQPTDAEWRGVGVIPSSGLMLRPDYRHLDALQRFSVDVQPAPAPQGCLCGKVLVGAIRPPECGLFGSVCTPQYPVGPCMVSSEGTCAAYYKYKGADSE